MKTYAALFFFLFSLLNEQDVRAQENCTALIKHIKGDSEWNVINYFPQIDKAVASECSAEDKVTLLLLKANYYSTVQQFETALQQAEAAEKQLHFVKNSDSLQALIDLRQTGYYAQMKQYFEAYREWTKCNNYYLLHKQYNGLSYTQQVLANIFLFLDQKEAAWKALQKAKKYAMIHSNKQVLSDLYNGMSTYWAFSNNADSALYYNTLGESLLSHQTIDLSRDYNKGIIYNNKGDTENARLYFQKTINDARKVRCYGYEGVGKYGLAITYLDDDPEQAFHLMKEALKLIDDYNPDLEINICECILDNFEGKEYEALFPFFENRKQVLTQSKKELEAIQVGKLFSMSSAMNDRLLLAQQEIENKRRGEQKREQQLLLLSIGGLFVLIVLLIALYFFSVISRSRKLLQQQNEQQRKVLNHSIVMITNYNAISEGVMHKLKQLALDQGSKKLSDQLYEIVRNIGELAVGTKSKELRDLDLVIQSINDGFVKKLCQRFPNLTSNEVTLAIYLRMNFTTKQISELKGSSENSIDVARSRLRSKLGIKGESVDLSIFLNKI